MRVTVFTMSRVSPEQQPQHRDDREQQCQPTDDQLQDSLNRVGDIPDRDPNRDVPYLQEIAPVLDEVVDIAREHLEHPISVDIKTWQDGEYKIRVRHTEPTADRFRRESVVQYHSKREDVEAKVARLDTEGDSGELLTEDTLGTIRDPLQKKRE